MAAQRGIALRSADRRASRRAKPATSYREPSSESEEEFDDVEDSDGPNNSVVVVRQPKKRKLDTISVLARPQHQTSSLSGPPISTRSRRETHRRKEERKPQRQLSNVAKDSS
jgi:hypothetical protein